MREKPSIRCTPAGWTVKLPGFGFNDPIERSFPTHREAGEWLTKVTAVSCSSTQAERVSQRADGIGSVAGWDPFQGYGYRF